ncbi:MAG: DUF998 domain-containing protein [Geodermatophilaceae bacterium]|nr:DUF998 domain-containing protein [Geodermatophilaceae bacterium]
MIIGGPIVYTATWLLLGQSHHGYSQHDDSISVLAAFGAPTGWLMTAAFVVQAAAMAAAGLQLRRTSGLAALLLVVNAVGTVVVAAAPISCGAQDATWCLPSEHPTFYAVHVAAATLALSALATAPLAYAVPPRRAGWPIAAVAGIVMVVLLGWFAVSDAAGWAEKIMITTGITWAAATAAGVRR